ncbi:MAG: tRNA (adenosine(37)-N6)-threonylcarbamoyltransferase complex ATPase subunit type 1 TsaE [Emcibacteraceae bacterium]|nr:tRNA (adenosine(37)-N6)-threonylcarbamoyltransferase complex ATPase subunit type 1 TsaE [Emcibacteraceae bacterium]
MSIKEFYLEDLSASKALAAQLASLFEIGDIITFEGNLGTGKTEFCRAIIHSLGFDEDVPSPTFSLLQTYEPALDDQDTVSIWHLDLYRLEKPEDVFELGIEDGFDTAVTLIEWPDKMEKHLPDGHLKIKLAMGEGDGQRKITFDGNDYWKIRLKGLTA